MQSIVENYASVVEKLDDVDSASKAKEATTENSSILFSSRSMSCAPPSTTMNGLVRTLSEPVVMMMMGDDDDYECNNNNNIRAKMVDEEVQLMNKAANETAADARRVVDDEAADVMFERGIRLIKSLAVVSTSDSDLKKRLYVFNGPKQVDGGSVKVASAIWFYPKMEEEQSGGTLNAGTTGSVDWGDNFDICGKLKLAVENGTFGLGKVCWERFMLSELLKNLLSDPKAAIQRYYEKNINSKFLSEAEKALLEEVKVAVMLLPCVVSETTKCDEEAEKAWRPLFDGLLHKGLRDTIASCDKIVNEKGVPESDPVYTLLTLMTAEFEAMLLLSTKKLSAEASFEEFKRIKGILLNSLPLLHPKIAKMGLGRGALFSLISEKWEGKETRLHMWSVFFARVYMLCSDPVCAYTFFVLNVFGDWHEFSKFDALWADLNKPQDPLFKKSGGALCDLRSADAAIATECAQRVEALMSRKASFSIAGVVRTSPYTCGETMMEDPKLLSVANNWVIVLLMHQVQFPRGVYAGGGFGGAPDSYMSEGLIEEMEQAKRLLTSAGWDTDFNRFYPAVEGTVGVCAEEPVGVFNVPRIPAKYAELMSRTSLKNTGDFLERLSVRLDEATTTTMIMMTKEEDVATVMTSELNLASSPPTSAVTTPPPPTDAGDATTDAGDATTTVMDDSEPMKKRARQIDDAVDVEDARPSQRTNSCPCDAVEDGVAPNNNDEKETSRG